MSTAKNLKQWESWAITARGIAASSAIVVMLSTGGLMAQETTSTANATTATATSAKAGKLDLSDSEVTQSVVLLGEKVGLNSDTPGKPPFPDLLALAHKKVGGHVADFTAQGQTIAQTAKLVAAAEKTKTDVAIVFAGFTDEKQEVDDNEQRASLDKLVAALKKNNPAIRIFLVPAATTVGTLTNANMRLASDGGNVVFVPLGTEVGGQPYEDALAQVEIELQTPVEPSTASSSSNQTPSKAVMIQSGKIYDSPAEPAAAKSYEEKKADLQSELNRIAGQAGDISDSLPPISETTDTASFLGDAGTTYPEGGILTKRGSEAHESINMRPLPAVKAFRPQVPVPRNEINKKEPALSR